MSLSQIRTSNSQFSTSPLSFFRFRSTSSAGMKPFYPFRIQHLESMTKTSTFEDSEMNAKNLVHVCFSASEEDVSEAIGSVNSQIPLVHQYDLGEGMLLQVKVYKSSHDSNTKIELQLRNCSKPFLLHWGAIYCGQTNWVLPADRPVGTKLFKQYALQTPFVKSGDIFFITIELRDPKIHAIEFVLKDERHDKWLKLNHKNFRIMIPESVKIYSHTSIPKDLVERKAYFLWESMGRPRNSPQQQQENYEVALRELQSQLSKGISLNELQSSFQAPGSKRAADTKESSSIVDSVPSSSYHGRHDVGQWLHQRSQGKTKTSNLVSPGGGVGNGIVKWLLDEISQKEKDAERSLMHRFNIATELTERCKNEGELGLIGIMVWFRFMACRHLTWNKNYNVKPREISTAQDKFTNLLQRIYASQPNDRELIRLIMTTIGRGGQGDVGQRIRDEILVLQRNNDCKGGMMEEWHQKLHNNSSPDDVIICQALLDYVRSNFKIDIYWRTLNANGLTKSILRSYDRPIVSEPHFRGDSKDGLLRDLTSYLKTLKAVHTGADLESAIETFLGYSSQGNHFMKAVRVNNVGGVSSRLQECLSFVKMHVDDKNIGPLMEKLLETRVELHPLLLASHEKLKDVIFLDLALDSAVRTTMERGLQELGNTHVPGIVFFISVMLQNLCLSTVGNEHLVYCAKDWYRVSDSYRPNDEQWALQAKAVIDRVRLALSDKSQDYHKMIQPSAQYLGNMLRVEKWAIDIFTEELIRTGSAATLSLLVNRLDPILRKIANLGCWQIISPVEVCGLVITVSELITVQTKVYAKPTIIIANKVTGEEEIPDGVVGVLTPDMPDVLSHVSVRARNSKVCFATCFDQSILRNLKLKEGKMISIKLRSTDLVISDISSDMSQAHFIRSSIPRGTTLARKTFGGKYALAVEEFTVEMVGAKSRNIQYLRGRVPSWIKIPTSVAIPFGVFETLLASDLNKDLSNKVSSFSRLVNAGDLSKLLAIQEIILQMKPSSQLINDLRSKMKSSRIPWPGDEGEERWNQGWQAIKKVWASKWNQRAFISCRKANINHDHVCMSVLIQEVINADYAFVIHTRNPLSGYSSEIYTEIVKGLGETLVGAYAGRAMSFIVKKSDLKSPIILGYPSKQIGLYIKKSLIFRSDSNGEDLEGYAGAGLYDSVPMDKEQKVVLDYSNDRLIRDKGFQRALFSKIAEVGKIIEDLYRSAQDIEGVVKDGEIYVVQTRPQI